MRTSGILMPVFSLPSKYGIGTLGKAAYDFVDFLKKSGQSHWQILPLGVTGYGDSPYQCFSAYAGNPYFIDLEELVEDKLLTFREIEALDWGEDNNRVDYSVMYISRYKALRIAYTRFKQNQPEDFDGFIAENSFWLEDYALYSAIKESLGGVSVKDWNDGYKTREPEYIEKAKTELSDEIGFHKMLQYLFSKQWFALKKYANENGIGIIGDIPIYVAFDSADVWSEPEQFLLDEKLLPKAVAGCPPDGFCPDGQLWGNPLYDWDYMQNDGFNWWIKRIEYSSKLYDMVRIDHFRAFAAFYSIPYGSKTAANGKWVKGPEKALFEAINKKLGKLNIIAEDLGSIDEPVRKLLQFTGFPGMKVLQFAFGSDSENEYLPHNITDRNCIVYTGTHDNDTAIGYMKEAPKAELEFAKKYLNLGEAQSFNWALIKAAMATPANWSIFQMQDFLGLDNSARINAPSTLGDNWRWRIDSACLNDWLAKIIYDTTSVYGRLPKKGKMHKFKA